MRARRPRSPRQDQDPVRRARSSNPGYPPVGLQRQSEKQARSAKAGQRQRAAQPQVSSIRGRHDSDMKSEKQTVEDQRQGAVTVANTVAKPLDTTLPMRTSVEYRPSTATATDGRGRCAP